MDNANPYQPPRAALELPEAPETATLYVVGLFKFWLLMVGTLGMYGLYWFYKNWALLNRQHKAYWPVMRSIFAIFFTHRLFDEVEKLRTQRQVEHRWSPGPTATLYVVCVLLGRMLDAMTRGSDELGAVDMLSAALFIPMCWSLYVAQRAINATEGDPGGERNRRITVPNVLWLIPGVLIWLIILGAVLMLALGEQGLIAPGG